MLCLEAMHNISTRLGRIDVRERGFCRLFNIWEIFVVVAL
jgi:hypothetical protein